MTTEGTTMSRIRLLLLWMKGIKGERSAREKRLRRRETEESRERGSCAVLQPHTTS